MVFIDLNCNVNIEKFYNKFYLIDNKSRKIPHACIYV